MNRAEINAMIAAFNQHCEDTRHRAEPGAYGVALAIVLGIVGACMLAHCCAV